MTFVLRKLQVTHKSAWSQSDHKMISQESSNWQSILYLQDLQVLQLISCIRIAYSQVSRQWHTILMTPHFWREKAAEDYPDLFNQLEWRHFANCSLRTLQTVTTNVRSSKSQIAKSRILRPQFECLILNGHAQLVSAIEFSTI